ncbi:MAG: flagellar hook-associated protein 3 [Candidatus Hydrogenedentes bacterium CG07_land_8_20_14_0_80_42_17]|nr:MAG: flagellar hook-associated protein 3 [Candidatus Hydrogenedentes bacterium CG07_land_8_20_14_0_80_42_17]
MNRVSFSRMVMNSQDYTRLNSEKLLDLQRQLSTGKKIEKASDDPDVAARSKRLQNRLRRDEQLVRNIENTSHMIGEAETQMSSVVEQLQRVRTLTLQAVNAPMTTADMALIATEINQQLEGMLRTGNTKVGGKTLFGGAETDQDAFTAARNGIGEIESVSYQGDDVELGVEMQGVIPITWPGSRIFSKGPMILKNTNQTWNGSSVSNYADREISAAFVPSSGVMEGSMRINGKLINYDLDGNPTSGEGDSLLDIARAINDGDAGVRAEVSGSMQGTTGVSTPLQNFSTEFVGFQNGTIKINGSSMNVTNEDTIFTLANRINSLQANTGVTADVYDANGEKVDGIPNVPEATQPLYLRLNGGVEIEDNGSSDSNIMQILGITSTPPENSGRNLSGNVIENYAIKISGDKPGPFSIEDASGSIVKDLGLTSGVVSGGDIFSTLISLRDKLREGDSSYARDALLPEIDSAMDSVEVYRTEAGVRTNLLDTRKSRLEEVITNNTKLLSDVEDVDLAEVITELRNQENTQTAALRAVSDVLKLSLLNYLG